MRLSYFLSSSFRQWHRDCILMERDKLLARLGKRAETGRWAAHQLNHPCLWIAECGLDATVDLPVEPSELRELEEQVLRRLWQDRLGAPSVPMCQPGPHDASRARQVCAHLSIEFREEQPTLLRCFGVSSGIWGSEGVQRMYRQSSLVPTDGIPFELVRVVKSDMLAIYAL